MEDLQKLTLLEVALTVVEPIPLLRGEKPDHHHHDLAKKKTPKRQKHSFPGNNPLDDCPMQSERRTTSRASAGYQVEQVPAFCYDPRHKKNEVHHQSPSESQDLTPPELRRLNLALDNLSKSQNFSSLTELLQPANTFTLTSKNYQQNLSLSPSENLLLEKLSPYETNPTKPSDTKSEPNLL